MSKNDEYFKLFYILFSKQKRLCLGTIFFSVFVFFYVFSVTTGNRECINQADTLIHQQHSDQSVNMSTHFCSYSYILQFPVFQVNISTTREIIALHRSTIPNKILRLFFTYQNFVHIMYKVESEFAFLSECFFVFGDDSVLPNLKKENHNG